jgi:hypothetical protein
VHPSLEGGIPTGRNPEVVNVDPGGKTVVNVEAVVEVGPSAAVVEVGMIEMIAAKAEVMKGADEILSAEAVTVTVDPPPGKLSNKKRSNR